MNINTNRFKPEDLFPDHESDNFNINFQSIFPYLSCIWSATSVRRVDAEQLEADKIDVFLPLADVANRITFGRCARDNFYDRDTLSAQKRLIEKLIEQ